MAEEFERRRAEPVVERTYVSGGSGAAGIIALIVAIAIGAFVFFTFYDRGTTPNSVEPTPRVTAPNATPPAKTAPPAPSTK
jgi:hypothetical protein